MSQSQETKQFSHDTARDVIHRTAKGNPAIFGLLKDYDIDDDTAFLIGMNNWSDIAYRGAWIWGAKPEGDARKALLSTEEWFGEVFEKMYTREIAKHMSPTDVAKQIKPRATIGDFMAKQLDSSAVSVMIPTVIDRGVTDEIARRTPAYAVTPKVAQIGKTAHVVKRTAGVDGEFVTEANAIAGTITSNDQTYSEATVDMKLLFTRGTVGLFAAALTETQIDLFNQAVNDHFLDFLQYKEKILFRGRITAGAETWGSYLTVAAGYDGIAKRVFDTKLSTNMEQLSSEYISLDHVDTAIEVIADNNKEVDAFFCDFNTWSRLRKEARVQQRLEQGNLAIGSRRPFTVDDIPVVPTAQLPRSANEKSLFALRFESIQYRVLEPDTFRIEAQAAEDARKFQWKTYEALLVVVPQWNYVVTDGI